MAGDIAKGIVIRLNNSPYLVVSKEFYSPAKGGSFTRTKLKNLQSGEVISRTFRTGEKFEEVSITKKKMQFLYNDEKAAYFMNPESFEQVSVSMALIDNGTDFLHAESKYMILFDDETVLSLELPPKVTLKVTQAASAVRGNTANAATKEVETETGYKLQVPLFVNEGDKIIINTETGKYVEKA